MGISVVICCYNSSTRLRQTLEHLAAQKVPSHLPWEIVLVDNASTDDTAATATDMWYSFGNPALLSVVPEPRKGINHARRKGISAARYNYVLFCDDDNWLSEHYLDTAFSIMESDASIGVCGGKGEAAFEAEEPSWFQQYKAVFACNAQAEKEGYLDIDHIGLYSAGMVIRGDAVLKILATGYESEFEARKDNGLSGGEDLELVVLIRTLGYKAYYSDRLTFQHFMPRTRMTWQYLKRLVRGTMINFAPVLVYSDTFRWLLTRNDKYKVNAWKDIARAIKSALSVKFSSFRDIHISWIKLTGGIASVINHKANYKRYREKLERLYEETHKGVR